ncbi:MAG: hypothetical protein ABSD61_02450 [Terracidiphilus sp.]|jgi:hypothetical protein
MNLSTLTRLTATLLIPALLSSNFAFAERKPVDPAAMKAKVQARGVGHGIRVTMADSTETKGVIVRIGDGSFTVKPKGAAQPQEIQYAQLTGVHNDKMGTGTKVIIIVAIAGAAIGITAAILVHDFNTGLPEDHLTSTAPWSGNATELLRSFLYLLQCPGGACFWKPEDSLALAEK